MKVSVVINTYNRAEYLDRALQSLYYQEYPDFEVIVVNGPSTDNTEEIMQKYAQDIKIGHCSEANLAISRNIGIAMASGDYVAFMDDDAVPEPEWLNVLLSGFTSDDIAAVGSDVYNPTGVEFQCRKLTSNRWGKDTQEKAVNIPHTFVFDSVIGTNVIFRRKELIKVGAFNEQYDYYLDETELCARIVDAGYQAKYIPNAFIHHKFAPSFYRDSRKVVLDWTKIVKNTIYFIKSYEDICGKEEADKQIELVKEQRYQDSRLAYEGKSISKEEYKNCLKTIDNGIRQGLKDFSRGYHLLITEETLNKYKSKYKKFPAFINQLRESKLNIVYLVNDYPPYLEGGIGRFVHALAEGVAVTGHQVHVITMSHNDMDTVDFENGVWVHRITYKEYPDHLINNLPFNGRPNHNRLCLLYSYYEELLKINSKRKVNIVQSPIWDCIGYYALLDSRFNNVISLHTTMMSVWKNINPRPKEIAAYLDLEEDMLQRAPHLLSNSNAIENTINEYYENVCNGKTCAVPHGLPDISKGIISQRQDDKVEILFLGRLEHRKGIDILLKCIPELCDKYPNIIFRFVGNDKINIPNKDITYTEEFFSVTDNKKYKNQMIFEGFVSEERMKQAYADCDIFVSPSRYESFGLIFLEAMMFAKPVIGCKAGGMLEVIEDNITGFLAQPEDVASLKDCLEKLITNKALRQKMGKAGRKLYEQKFTDNIMAENVLKVYQKLLNKNKD